MSTRRFTCFFMTALIALGLWLTAGQRDLLADEPYSPLSLTIQFSKDQYAFDEPIDGKVVIKNSSAAGFPAVFQVSLFQGQEFKYATVTSLDTIFPGKTSYTFEEMGVPQPSVLEKSIGEWRLDIAQFPDVKVPLGSATFHLTEKPLTTKIKESNQGGY